MPCPLCGGRGDPSDREGYRLCCSGYLSPRTVTYDERYWPERTGTIEAHRALLTSDRLEWWLAHIPSRGRILEVGCAPGALLDALLARGDDAWGVDPTYPGKRVKAGLFPAATWPGPFDAVVMLDVLEHLDDPRAGLAAAHELLRPGGALYLQIPTLRGQPMEDRFWCAGEHTWIPRQGALNLILIQEGFTVEDDREAWHAGHEWTVARSA